MTQQYRYWFAQCSYWDEGPYSTPEEAQAVADRFNNDGRCREHHAITELMTTTPLQVKAKGKLRPQETNDIL
jgi:hypothetical protein